MDLNQTNDEKFTDEEIAEVDRLQSDPSSEYYYNDPDNEEGFLDKVKRKLEPYGEDFKGFIEYLFTPSRHFGTGQYNEGGVAEQMDMFGYTDKGVKQEADKFVKEAGNLEEDISKAASFVVPFYESGVNISNVVQEYMKPEQERDYDYIKKQFTEAGQSAAIEAGLLLMGGVAAKYGAKGIKSLYNKVKQVEVKTDPNTVSMLGMGSITISKKPAIKEGVPTIEAAGLTDEAIETWRKKNETSEEFRKSLKGRNPELQELAKGVSEGRVFSTTYRKRADELRPIRVVKEVPKPATNKEIVSALNDKQRRNPIIGLNEKVSTGEMVDVRLNIPAYTDYDVWVPTIRHNGKEKYKAAVRLKNVNFIKPTLSGSAKRTDSSKALKVAEGGQKSPFAVMTGEYVDGADDELFTMAKEVFDSSEWTQVGYDPIKRGFFYDRETGQAILEADEVIQVGHLVLAKNAKKSDPDVFPFNKGGVAMNEQMEMAFMQQGGIKDDGMNKDPVSGNPIPPGSMASEVRDDIPAMLSEGEYVVPADVLRFYGVNFFENLRGQAKSGLQNMEKNGRIGGEPLSQQQVQQNMGQSGVTMQANQGGVVGYNPGGLQNQLDPYMEQSQKLGGGFDPSQYSTVGGSVFGNTSQDNSITRIEIYVNAETGETRSVNFVSSGTETKIVPPSDEQYTRPPYYLQGSSALKQAQQTVPTDGGGSDPKDPPETKPKQPFGIDVDWSDPKAYADSLLEGPDGLPKSVQMLSALAGPLGMAAVGGANAAMTLGKISDLRAAKIVAQAQGDTSTATYIDKELGKFIKRSPNIVSFLEKAVAPGTSKAKEVLDRLGLDYEEDKKGNITFTERMQELNNRILRETRMFSAAGRKELMTQFEKDRFSGDGNPNVYRPGGIDVSLGQGSSSDNDYNAAQAASRAAAAARRAAMEEAQAAGGSSDDIADLREKYEDAGGTWASGGRAEGGLMTKAKKRKK